MTRPLHTACCALALACLPAIAADNTRNDIQPADLVHILIGAYEGAADAADRSGHPFGGERLSHEDLVRLEANVQQLQQGLRDITKADGSLDSDRIATLLNDLQDRRGESRTIDFVRALNTLRELEKQPDGFTLDSILNLFAGRDGSRSANNNGAPLLDTLKLVYADRQLGSPDAAREAAAHRLINETLARGALDPARHAEIAGLLEKLGAPYRDDYQKWQATPPRIAVRPDTNTETDILRQLENLTPAQRERILQILREKEPR